MNPNSTGYSWNAQPDVKSWTPRAVPLQIGSVVAEIEAGREVQYTVTDVIQRAMNDGEQDIVLVPVWIGWLMRWWRR